MEFLSKDDHIKLVRNIYADADSRPEDFDEKLNDLFVGYMSLLQFFMNSDDQAKLSLHDPPKLIHPKPPVPPPVDDRDSQGQLFMCNLDEGDSIEDALAELGITELDEDETPDGPAGFVDKE